LPGSVCLPKKRGFGRVFFGAGTEWAWSWIIFLTPILHDKGNAMISYEVQEFDAPLVRAERPTPVPQNDEVLVRVLAAGVCHSDLHIWHGSYDMGHGKKLNMAERGLKLPVTLGHEIAGEVVAVGPQAQGVNVGQKYVVFPWLGCGQCKVCQRGDENLCMTGRPLGVYQPGGYADHILVPSARYLVEMGDLAPEHAAPYACSGLTTYSALKKFSPRVFKDETLVLIGAGGLGLMAILIARALGGAGVVVIEPDASKREAALKVGAQAAFDPAAPGCAAAVRKAAGGAVWMVLDCVGSSQTVEQGIGLLTKGGHLVQIGLFGGHIDLPTPSQALRAITYQGTYVGNLRELQELIELVRETKMPPVPTTCMHFSKAFSALLALEQGQAIGRQVLTPGA
jgi:propanol-preferring alcohol dehydrogenase